MFACSFEASAHWLASCQPRRHRVSICRSCQSILIKLLCLLDSLAGLLLSRLFWLFSTQLDLSVLWWLHSLTLSSADRYCHTKQHRFYPPNMVSLDSASDSSASSRGSIFLILATQVAMDPVLVGLLEHAYDPEKRERLTAALSNLLPENSQATVKNVWCKFSAYCK